MTAGLLMALAFVASPRPDGCVDVAPGQLQPALDRAAAGAVLCLAPGVHEGPARIARPLVIWGPRAAVVRSAGAGTTVAVEPGAAGTRLTGFTLDGSGARYDQLDAALAVHADGVVAEGLRIERALFGVLVERARGVRLAGLDVSGDAGPAMGLRGDAIRVWESPGAVVEGNRVSDGRDVVVWYSSYAHVRGNEIARGRYGTHLMYSHDAVVEDNRYVGDVVGVFVMYSHRVVLTGNQVIDAAGAAGIGIGLKDSGDIRATGNRLIHDTIGIYVDSSPLQQDERDVFEGNLIRLCEQGIVFLSSPQRNLFQGNALADNGAQVVVEGGGDATGIEWRGNYFDDYAGFDLDGDGRGDVAYELRSLSAELVSAHPDLRFFEGAPALSLLDATGRLLPLYAPRLVLRDERPLIFPPEASGAN